MTNIEKYIEQLKVFISSRKNINENLIIRHVFYDLAYKFDFDTDFYPFGNSEKKKHIYNTALNEDTVEECMEKYIGICKSIAKAAELILSGVDIDIETVIDYARGRNYPHVYNIIYPNDGSEPYSIDIQDDMYRVKMHAFPVNYGISITDGTTQVIPRFEQEQMDRELGYIDDEHYYSDEYLYLVRSDMDLFENFGERVQFVLENIEVFENPDVEYTDRQWYHVRILQQLFSTKDFDYDTNQGRIHFVDCFKEINGEKKLINCIAVQAKSGTEIYIYNKKEFKYSKIDIRAFARAVKNGLTIYRGKVPGLGGALQSIKATDAR